MSTSRQNLLIRTFSLSWSLKGVSLVPNEVNVPVDEGIVNPEFHDKVIELALNFRTRVVIAFIVRPQNAERINRLSVHDVAVIFAR